MAASSKSDRLGSGKLILALLSAIIVVTQSLPFQDERRSNLDPTGDGSITKKNSCGIRSLGVPLNNATQASNFNVEYFRTQPESFPWIVKLVLDSLTIKNENENKDKLLLCTGVAVSSFVAIFPAHCVSGNEKSRLTVVQTTDFSQEETFPVENIILHPDYVFKHASHQHDIALVKIRDFKGFHESRVACLPEFDEDPVDECQIVNYFPDEKDSSKVSVQIRVSGYIVYRLTCPNILLSFQYSVLSHWLSFGPSEACIETPHLRGYIDSTLNILCSEADKCQPFVQVKFRGDDIYGNFQTI